ncbi:manganese efflux pump, partial [Candidatus Bathyarchaeota archaeon]|nr:manganese efflux pump [Candidatus Bathyarchaeota archaeon]
VGNRTGKAFGKKAQIMGGLVLIGIGARIVFTHLV